MSTGLIEPDFNSRYQSLPRSLYQPCVCEARCWLISGDPHEGTEAIVDGRAAVHSASATPLPRAPLQPQFAGSAREETAQGPRVPAPGSATATTSSPPGPTCGLPTGRRSHQVSSQVPQPAPPPPASIARGRVLRHPCALRWSTMRQPTSSCTAFLRPVSTDADQRTVRMIWYLKNLPGKDFDEC